MIKLKFIPTKIGIVITFSLLFSGCGTASKEVSGIMGGNTPSYKFSKHTGMPTTTGGKIAGAAAIFDVINDLGTFIANSDTGQSIGNSIRNSNLVVYGFDGFDEFGYHKETKTEFDSDGFNVDGFDEFGYHKETKTEFDSDGFNVDGYNISGFNRDGFHKDTDTKFDNDGFNAEGEWF
ncbi:hypothetical protein OAR97_04560 [Arcobacteraceae bacterium]|nr:hypothetical protein [Arcobacteraceae bacterium]